MEKLLTDEMREKMTKDEITYFYARSIEELNERADKLTMVLEDAQEECKKDRRFLNIMNHINLFIYECGKHMPDIIVDNILLPLSYKLGDVIATYDHKEIKLVWDIEEYKKTYERLRFCMNEIMNYFQELEAEQI